MSYPSHSLRPSPLGGIGRACYRHRWLTLIAWVVGLACLVTLWIRFGAPADDNFGTADPGQTLLNAHFHRQSGDTLTLAIHSAQPISSPAVHSRITSALVPFEHAPKVTQVTSPYAASTQISRDGHIAFASVHFSVTATHISSGEATDLMHDATTA